MPGISLLDELDGNEWESVARAIVWERPDQDIVRFRDWTEQQRKSLAKALLRILSGQTLGLSAAPPLSVAFPPTADAWTCLSPSVAWRYFVGHVAQSLAFDRAQQAAGPPGWSLRNFSPGELALLLDSRLFAKWYPAVGAYVIEPDYLLGSATPGDPVRTFRFIRAHRLLARRPRETVCKLLSWCRDNLLHFGGGHDIANVLDHWGYAGVPPVEYMCEGTTKASQGNMGPRHWTMGCHGTTGFLRCVLRTVNIPVEMITRCNHALPHFVRQRLYLSHGDDPYGGLSEATPPIPIQDVPIDKPKFDAWFDSALPATEICSNVGRHSLELAIAYLPNYLLHQHCYDLSAGLGHANSTVYATLQGSYTVAELEAVGLWLRMDAKIAQLGGCANVPAVRYGT